MVSPGHFFFVAFTAAKMFISARVRPHVVGVCHCIAVVFSGIWKSCFRQVYVIRCGISENVKIREKREHFFKVVGQI